MKKVLLTGASGFMGSNALPSLEKKYCVYAPKRNELDVRDTIQVQKYLKKENFDIIVHFASPSPVRSPNLDSYETLFEDSMKIFMNFYSMRHYFGKMFYSGSGAEFDKRRDIISVKEEEIGKYIPGDSYGLSKYIINELACHSENIYNLRIFACFGPREYDSKFITHAIKCCLERRPITIRQDCWFDYLYVEDYVRFLMYFMEYPPHFHDYNVVSGQRIKLTSIAEIVREKLGSHLPIEVLKEGMNKEYTASNSRMIAETGLNILNPIETGIEKLIGWEKNNYEKTCR